MSEETRRAYMRQSIQDVLDDEGVADDGLAEKITEALHFAWKNYA